ncbi:hypothetical protein C9374_013940 [Naegleria lovaniensis]|uniref:Uncharacterized protein n=1 Tax=Naegleria lovaniensis TaxID=51637 RepID=A0AA88KMW2_NAELO|nr:uncharacterized protein C9374_013940 [Naegleria lovaniensis]KAG2389380.1 hypothetical protein C9374_013940 [Naegleria lovaniensis]
MGNSYVSGKSTTSQGFYRQHEPNYAPTFDSHSMIFEPSNAYMNWPITSDPECEHDGTVFLTLGNYQYGQLLHKRPRDIVQNMPNDICMETLCHPLIQSNGVRCSNQNIRMIECGIAQTFLVTIDNLVYVSGNSFFGQLGLNHAKTVYEPVRLNFAFDSQIIEVSCGQFHTLFLTAKGSVYVCGYNYYSQLSISETWMMEPTLVKDLDTIHHVYSGQRFTLFQTHDGTILLNGDIEETNLPVNRKPVFVQDPTDPIRRVACGDCHFIILTQLGRVYVFGRNYSGALGLGHTEDVFDVTELSYKDIVKSDTIIVDVQCGDSHTMFRTRDGMIYGCGYNTKGQLGIPHSEKENFVATITDLKIQEHTGHRITDVRCGRECTVFLTDKNEIFISGQLWRDQCFQQKPTKFHHPIFEKKNICSMAVGGYHVIIYLEDKFIKDYSIEFEDENNTTCQIKLSNITSIESFIDGIEKHAKLEKKSRKQVFYLVWNTNFNRFEFICNIRTIPSQCFVKRMIGTLSEVVSRIEPSYHVDSFVGM